MTTSRYIFDCEFRFFSVVEPVGELMSYRNTMVINWVSQGQAVKFKDVLTTYIRTMTPSSSLGMTKKCTYELNNTANYSQIVL